MTALYHHSVVILLKLEHDYDLLLPANSSEKMLFVKNNEECNGVK